MFDRESDRSDTEPIELLAGQQQGDGKKEKEPHDLQSNGRRGQKPIEREGNPGPGAHVQMPMQSARSFLLFILVPSVTAVLAQHTVRINEATGVIARGSLAGTPHAVAGMKAAGIEPGVIEAACKFSDPASWPAGWQSDSARVANQHILVNAKAYELCNYAVNDQPLAIIHVPAIENFHMPDGMRGTQDMYMLVKADAIAHVQQVEVARPSEGPNWRSMPKARITAPAQVYSTYDLGRDNEAIAVLREQGMSQAEIDAVIFRSHERNWPDGISELGERVPKHEQFKKFQAHIAARWGDKVLLVIPAELNRKLPPSLRPYMDIYMVYTSPAVAVMKK